MIESLNGAVIFIYLFAGVCALTVIFVLVCVPETKGKTLAQIQLELSEVSPLIEPY